jgi:choline dehydrogenase
MNVIMPPDQHWNSLAEITGDDSWAAENVRPHYEAWERNVYTEPGSPGHGYDGYISVSARLR